eukprot:CAMPEP_0113478002 /NCGR_PEP_ID=MMETSP0014_2-20120614/20509_1 /TAXON_ID=2857 /ORGANISM="Nitzschia sp." /LENGTH=738 /DNA_ID=CAMNT_0000371135 /DNA_START=88 /DNA_END=2300 /DNA_ORIENTATION=- /assembly_acc=CAM_ASM_000159
MPLRFVRKFRESFHQQQQQQYYHQCTLQRVVAAAVDAVTGTSTSTNSSTAGGECDHAEQGVVSVLSCCSTAPATPTTPAKTGGTGTEGGCFADTDESKYIKRKRQQTQIQRRRFFMTTMVCFSSIAISVLLVVFVLRPPITSSPLSSHRSHQRQKGRGGRGQKQKHLFLKSRNSPITSFFGEMMPSGAFFSKMWGSPYTTSSTSSRTSAIADQFWEELERLDDHIIRNTHLEDLEGRGTRFFQSKLLVPRIQQGQSQQQLDQSRKTVANFQHSSGKFSRHGPFFQVSRRRTKMAWETEWSKIKSSSASGRQVSSSFFDYTRPESYMYPDKQLVPSDTPDADGVHLPLSTLGKLLQRWPQHAIDYPPLVSETEINPKDVGEGRRNDGMKIQESLQHFDYMNATEMETALKFRDMELPFKIINVPDLVTANTLWTDDYLIEQFDGTSRHSGAQQHGKAQESPDSFFPFFQPQAWNVVDDHQNSDGAGADQHDFKGSMGLPPTRNNDWSFETFVEHSSYADAAGLDADQPHFYWQAQSAPLLPIQRKTGEATAPVDATHVHFISQDLPTFASPTPNFINSSPPDSKGIQCRFGERGVTAAMHFDNGQNMVGMVTGAKRYILLPPNQCNRLNIQTSRDHAAFRHSLLDYGHLQFLSTDEEGVYSTDDDDDNFSSSLSSGMSRLEREWLREASGAKAVETVLKAGEVLYIPSFWFHYIIGLQKNTQCNVRSGTGNGSAKFGGP